MDDNFSRQNSALTTSFPHTTDTGMFIDLSSLYRRSPCLSTLDSVTTKMFLCKLKTLSIGALVFATSAIGTASAADGDTIGMKGDSVPASGGEQDEPGDTIGKKGSDAFSANQGDEPCVPATIASRGNCPPSCAPELLFVQECINANCPGSCGEYIGDDIDLLQGFDSCKDFENAVGSGQTVVPYCEALGCCEKCKPEAVLFVICMTAFPQSIECNLADICYGYSQATANRVQGGADESAAAKPTETYYFVAIGAIAGAFILHAMS